MDKLKAELAEFKKNIELFEHNMKAVLEIEKENVRKETAKEILQDLYDEAIHIGTVELTTYEIEQLAKKYGVEVEE